MTLALKWKYLDHLAVGEIQERFEDEGFGELARSTIRGYLNDKPKEEVLEQIEAKHADVRLQIAEREEELFERARESEREATTDEPRQRVVPATSTVRESDAPMEVPDWEILDEDDPRRPEWAAPKDIIIEFDESSTRHLRAGDEYPQREFDGSPKYTTSFAGLERDQPDLQVQAAARSEQSQHLEAKGKILGAYEENINLNADVDVDADLGLDEETEAAVLESIRERQQEDASDK